VWYAQGDSLVPPDHGKWLAKSLATKGGNLDIKSEKQGLGHLAYLMPEHSKNCCYDKGSAGHDYIF